MDETPFVPKQVVEYLKETYSLQNMIGGCAVEEPAQAIGYLNGVYDVINRLEAISKEDDRD